MRRIESIQPENHVIEQSFTVAAVQQYLTDLEELVADGKDIVDGRMRLYLSASDSFTNIDHGIAVQDKHVATVASSGEFGQLFIGKGASELTIVDHSMAALLHSELRIAAMRCLDYDTYVELWSTWHSDRTLFNEEIYRRVRTHLSPQAKVFFDRLIASELPLFKRKTNNFSTTRLNRDGKVNKLFDGYQSAAEYEATRAQAKSKDIHMTLLDINKPATEKNIFAAANIIYLSNVGYRVVDSLRIASTTLTSSDQNVYFTVGDNDQYDLATLSERQGRTVINDQTYELNIEARDPNAALGILCSLRLAA